jgi:lipase maturation factor 1
MWNPESYTTAASLLPRLLGFIYFCAISAFLFQMRGLLGKNGILPICEYLDYFRLRTSYKRFFYIPTLFWFNASDRTIMGFTIVGTFLSILLMLGYVPSLCLALLFVIYLSIVSTGQDFLSFGWETFLLEITFYTFLVSLTPISSLLTWINLNFLLFRFHIQAGAVKLQSRDPAWRDLTALKFHYQSQPLPNMWAWFVYKWPTAFHKASTLFMFFVELVVPFGLFLTDDIRAAVGIAFIALQVIIWSTGNFSYLNHLTASFSIIAFNNSYLSFIQKPLPVHSSPWFLQWLLSVIGALFIILQCVRLWNHFQPQRRILAEWLHRLSFFHLVNHYGLFAIMTKERIEIVVEGSEEGTIWKEYLCRYKPSEVTRRPRRISPYQPRLDWQMWFLPFDDFESETWFQEYLYHLLKGTPEVLKLIRYNPFPDKPPKYIRALMYDYRFSTKQQKRENGWWWQRDLIGFYSPIMMLQDH